MSKSIEAHWFLQHVVDEIVRRLAPGLSIAPIVRFRQDQISWDEECRGVGRVAWRVDFFTAPEDQPARALIPALVSAMAPYQAIYDLGVVCG
jgi:hypothetical protein